MKLGLQRKEADSRDEPGLKISRAPQEMTAPQLPEERRPQALMSHTWLRTEPLGDLKDG